VSGDAASKKSLVVSKGCCLWMSVLPVLKPDYTIASEEITQVRYQLLSVQVVKQAVTWTPG
jgi:hypothetical protein